MVFILFVEKIKEQILMLAQGKTEKVREKGKKPHKPHEKKFLGFTLVVRSLVDALQTC